MQVLNRTSSARRVGDLGDPVGRRGWPPLGLFPTVLVVGAAYYLAAVLSLRVALVQGIVTPLWPPTGIAVAALLILGYRAWPGILVAAFLVNAPISSPVAAAGGIAVGNTLAPLFAAFLLRRVGFRPELDRLRDALALVFLGALGGMLVSATIGTASLVVSGELRTASAGQTWWVWWTGDAMGVLVFAPLLLGLRLRRPVAISWRRSAEAVLLLGGLFLVARLVLWSQLPVLYLVFPVLVLIVLRFREHGAPLAVLVATATAVWAAVDGVGPFAGATLFHKMLTLQVYNGALALTSFVLAAILAERDRAQASLARTGAELEERVHVRTAELTLANQRLAREMAERREAEVAKAQLATIVETSDDAIFSRSIDGSILTWNAAAERLFGFDQDEIVGRSVVLLDPPQEPDGLDLSMGQGEHRHEETVRLRKDGSQVEVSLTSSPIMDGTGRVIGHSVIARDITERKRAEEELRRSFDLLRVSDRERRRLLSRLVSAQEQERERIALDVHDDQLQRMTAVGVRLQILRSKVRDEEALEAMDRLAASVDGAVRGLRHLVFQLHPRSLDHDGLAMAMREYLKEWREELGVVTLESLLVHEPPIETRRTAYRVAVEALANVRKHAKASRVVVTLREEEGERLGAAGHDDAETDDAERPRVPGLLVMIEDDGIGFDVGAVDEGMPGHLGLASMRERAEIAGGHLHVESEPGRTLVELWLPSTR